MGRKTGWLWILALLPFALGILLVSGKLWAAQDSICFECHSDKDLVKIDESGREVSLYVDKANWENSVHADISCVGCHTDLEDMEAEHAPKLQSVNCGQCHEEVDEEYQKSLHAEAIKRGVKDSARCSDCHGSHYIYPKEHILSKVNPLNLEGTCDRCHANVAFVREHRGIPDRVLPGLIYRESVHGRAVERGIEGAAACNDCHSSHNLRGPLDPESLISRQNVSSTCGKCHSKAFEEYEGSIHGLAAKRGVGRSPVCTDCHGIHSIKAKVDPASSVAEKKIAMTTCPQCHGAEWITREYGVSTLNVKSYLDSYHGLAKKGGDVVAANCASCHGVHDIRPSSDPKSMVHKSNLIKTCGSCHPGASENFARFPVHFTPSTEVGTIGDKVASWVRVFYVILIILVVVFMYFHGGIDFIRKWLAARKKEGAKYYERLTANERIQHGLLAASFTILVITGFALKYPDAWWVGIFFHPPASAMRSLLHRIAGVLVVLLGIYHILYMVSSRRGRSHMVALIPTFKDLLDAFKMMGYDLGISKERPKFGRYSYIEKIEYFGALWGTFVMVVTGFILWYPKYFSLFLPSWGVNVARLIHFYEAILASMTILVWHFYSVMFDPDVYPMNWAKITGKISEEEMRHHHPLELEEIDGRKLVLEEMEKERSAEEVIARAEEKMAGERTKYRGPWNLISRMSSYSSKKFKLDQAKKTLKEEKEQEEKKEKKE
jgi:formate dehydrogenase gamma subunit